jgi:hypothetical protein
MKFEKIQPDMVLYDVHSTKMGNTTQSTVGVWTVRILSVDPGLRTAMVSWNGNSPQQYSERNLAKLRVSKPLLIKSGWSRRLATRAEIKAAALEKAKSEALTLQGVDYE